MTKTTFVNVAGNKTQMTVGGSGPPLLYLHSAVGETEWLPFHERLAERFTVHLPAHPGFALSEGLEAIRDIQDMAWHYVDLLESCFGAGPVPIVGFSLGGWLALELAVLRPQQAGRLVLIAAAGLHLPEAPVAEIFVDDLQQLKELTFLDPSGPRVNDVFPADLEDPRIVHWLRAREAVARVAWNPYLHNPRLPRHLRRVRCPVRLLWGRHDRLIPAAHGAFYAEHLPDASLRVFEQAAHMLPIEQADACAEAVLDFL